MDITNFKENIISKIRHIDGLAYMVNRMKNCISKLFKVLIECNNTVPNNVEIDIRTIDDNVIVNEININKYVTIDPRIFLTKTKMYAADADKKEMENSLITLIYKKNNTEAMIVEFVRFRFGVIKNQGKIIFIDFVTGNIIDFKNIGDLPFWLHSKGITSEKCRVRNLELKFKDATEKRLISTKMREHQNQNETGDIISEGSTELEHIQEEVVIIKEKQRNHENLVESDDDDLFGLEIKTPRRKKGKVSARRAVTLKRTKIKSKNLKRKAKSAKRKKKNLSEDGDEDGRTNGIVGNGEIKRKGRKKRKMND